MQIQIITGAGKPFGPQYLLFRLMECWQEAGHTVAVGPHRQLDADVGIVHVDSTVVPAHCLPNNPHARPLVNGGILDISKTRISRQRVLRGDDWAGPVIVKTNDNAHGGPEFRTLGRWSLPRLCRRLTKRLPWQWVGCLPRAHYPVLDRQTDVPGWVWRRPELIVERFLPERDGTDYVLRSWLFFGEQGYSVKLVGPHPIVKAGNICRHEYLHEVPDSIRAARLSLGVDFGKFDYVLVDGEAVLLDVNKTPSILGPRTPNLIRLASGLAALADRVHA